VEVNLNISMVCGLGIVDLLSAVASLTAMGVLLT